MHTPHQIITYALGILTNGACLQPKLPPEEPDMTTNVVGTIFDVIELIEELENAYVDFKTRFFDLVKVEPIFDPIGVMEISAPNVNNPIPTIIITAPIKNDSKIPAGKGAILRHKIETIIIIGNTDIADSLIFSIRTVLFLLKKFFIFISKPSFHCNFHIFYYII